MEFPLFSCRRILYHRGRDWLGWRDFGPFFMRSLGRYSDREDEIQLFGKKNCASGLRLCMAPVSASNRK